MKLLYFILLLSLFARCSNQPVKNNPEEKKSITTSDTTPGALKTVHGFGPNKIDKVIDEPSARTLHTLYLSNPNNQITDTDGHRIRGWYINQKDIDILKSNAKAGARIYLGYDGKIYHLIMVAVNSDSSNYLVGNSILDDFLPCPTQCPSEKSKAVWKSDLNYKRMDGNGNYYFQDFDGKEIIKQ